MAYKTRREFMSIFARYRGVAVSMDLEFRDNGSPVVWYIWEGDDDMIDEVRREYKAIANSIEMEKMEVDFRVLRNMRIQAFKDLRDNERTKKGVKENDK